MNYEARDKEIVEKFDAGATMKQLARAYAVSLFEIEEIMRWAMKRKPQRIYKIQILNAKLPKHRFAWFRIVARNGKILAHSETYLSRKAALKSARALASAKLVVEEKR